MKVFYLPLESYEERYTLQLRDWTMNRFLSRGIEVVEVQGNKLLSDGKIHTGIVLDAHGRSYFSLTQLANLVELMRNGEVTSEDVIYNQDYFHPGWEALAYIIQQSPINMRPRVYSHLLAQTIDPNDFTFPMRQWMRHYELMVDKTITGIFVASTVMVDMLRASMFEAPIHVVGLPFDKDEVRSRVKAIKSWEEKQKRIVFTSRWDIEKQPWFYMDLIEEVQNDSSFKDWSFAICTGSPSLRSNNQEFVKRAKEMEHQGKLKIYEGLTKTEYYEILNDSRIQFNCALQDFVSNTLNESSALGTVTLAPAYLSFPEAMFNEAKQLYSPWSIEDAISKLKGIISNPPSLEKIEKPSYYQHKTLDRVIDVLNFESSDYMYRTNYASSR